MQVDESQYWSEHIETWKATHVEKCLTKMYPGNRTIANNTSTRLLRTNPNRELRDCAKTRIGEHSFYIDGGKLWNICPQEIRNATKINEAKRLIKLHCKKMPV